MEFTSQPQVIVLCGLFCFVTFVWRIFSMHAKSNEKNNSPPQPAGAWPIIGHLHLLGGNKLLHHVFGEMADKYGPVFLLRLGVHKTVVVNSWEVAKECFTVQDKVFASHPKSFALEFMGYDQGMLGFLPYGENWRDLRKLVMVEMLCNRRLEKLKHVPESEVNFFIKGLYELWISKGAGNSMPVVELKERFGDLTMNIIVRMVVGKHYFSTGEESRRFQKALENFMYLMGSIMVSDAFPLFGWIDSLTGYKAKMKKTAKDLDQILDRWMKEHREERKLSSINELQQDFMHVMLTVMDSDPSAQISDTSIKGTCLNLLLGGFDTVMVTLTWAVSLLLNNRHMLKNVQDELEKHVGRDRQVNESDMKNLPYLRAIVKETLRLYPAGPLAAPHEAMEDCTLAGFHISVGTHLFVNLSKLQRDPSIWSNPLEFQPERFLEKHVDIDMFGKNFELIPFGSGRRACPGIPLALQVLHLTLARFLHGFELGTVSDLPIDMTESAGLSNPKATPLEVTFRPRLVASLYV
ncbi:Xanthotoxin hydroxylase CYP82C [Heracleum sosnowskyi]|uniref:Xanthotoxin hydroxylase CYP82C n=1 Tax=Heracleum sosnowskyi TaxID=360622 RepID=A0AAD8H0C1_9APIA|nr:Xanthotoxin hydroxylase CYP82C [Heracleum sosnowskyi]